MVRKVDRGATSLHQSFQLLSALRVLEDLLLERDYLCGERLVHLQLGLLLVLQLLQLDQQLSLRVLLRRVPGIYCLPQKQVVCVHVIQLALHSCETVLELLASAALLLIHLLQVSALCSCRGSWLLLLLGLLLLGLLSGGLFLFFLHHHLLLNEGFALLWHDSLNLLLLLVNLGSLGWLLLDNHAVQRLGEVLLRAHRLSSS